MQPKIAAHGINHVSLLRTDRERHARALDVALGDTTGLLGQHASRCQLLSSTSLRDRLATRLAGTSGDQLNSQRHSTPEQPDNAAHDAQQLLLTSAQLQHAQVHAQRVAELAARAAALHVSAAVLEKDEAALRQRFQRKRGSLAEAIAEDARLAGMTEAEITADVRRKRAEQLRSEQLMHLARNQRSLHARSSALAELASGAALDCSTAEAEDIVDEITDIHPSEKKIKPQLHQPDDLDAKAQELLVSMDVGREIADDCTNPSSLLPERDEADSNGAGPAAQLPAIATALAAQLPAQQASLTLARRRAAVLGARLRRWGARPCTYAGDLALTPQQRSLRGMAQTIVDELLSAAMTRIAMRPKPAQVAREAAEWRAAGPQALVAIGRHLAVGLMQEVVDELLLEAANEAAANAAQADAFACKLLVMAITHSSSIRRAAAGGTPARAGVQTRVPPGAAGASTARRMQAVAGRGTAEDAFAVSTADVSQKASYTSQAAPAVGSYDSCYTHVLGGMLQEMRRRRPSGMPLGHTQPLTPHLPPGTVVSKAQRIALSRMRPPLAASRGVWRHCAAPAARVQAPPQPTQRHLAVAVRERELWAGAALRPRMQRGSLPRPASLTDTSLLVPDALGYITALSGCPWGALLAAGTSKGALLVWDVRVDREARPLFQVAGGGQPYLHRWWAPWATKPPARPGVTGLTWSADGFQLAALDASSNLYLWWMRPERHQTNQGGRAPFGQPSVPELALFASPPMLASSGKAPLQDEDVEASAAEAAVAAASAAAGTSAGAMQRAAQLRQRIGNWLHPEAAKSPLPRDVPSWRWTPIFHPSVTIAGAQPAVMLPQVTGDVLYLMTRTAGVVLPGLGRCAVIEGASGGLHGAAAAAAAVAAAEPVDYSDRGRDDNDSGGNVSSDQAPAVQQLLQPQGCGAAVVPHDDPLVQSTASVAASSTTEQKSQQQQQQQQQPRRAGVRPLGASKRPAPVLPQSVDLLTPPAVIHPGIALQALHRGHDAPVVLLAFLHDSCSLLSLDTSGCLLLWPASHSERSSFGWVSPCRHWQLPRSVRMCRARGTCQPFFPQPTQPRRGVKGHSIQDKAGNWAGVDADEAALLQHDPTGAALLRSRVLWMVRYVPAQGVHGALAGAGGAATTLLRQVLHRPLDVAGGQHSSCSLVVSTFDAASGKLLARARQRCAYARAPLRVVAGELTAQGRDLLVVCRVPPSQDDPDARSTLLAMVVCLSSMRALTPRIELPDPGGDAGPPAYALTGPLSGAGSEYLLAPLGGGVLGVFSLATGLLVRELHTGVAALGPMALLRVSQRDEAQSSRETAAGPAAAVAVPATAVAGTGKAGTAPAAAATLQSRGGSNAGKTLLALASGVNSGGAIYIAQLDVVAMSPAAHSGAHDM